MPENRQTTGKAFALTTARKHAIVGGSKLPLMLVAVQ